MATYVQAVVPDRAYARRLDHVAPIEIQKNTADCQHLFAVVAPNLLDHAEEHVVRRGLAMGGERDGVRRGCACVRGFVSACRTARACVCACVCARGKAFVAAAAMVVAAAAAVGTWSTNDCILRLM